MSGGYVRLLTLLIYHPRFGPFKLNCAHIYPKKKALTIFGSNSEHVFLNFSIYSEFSTTPI